jgi:UrcA family protein
MTINRMKLAFAGLSTVCGILAVGTATHGFAKSPITVIGRGIDPETTRIVSYADLNLQSGAGRQVLLRRVAYAVRDLCQVNPGWNGLEVYMRDRQCFNQGWNSASPQINRAFDLAAAGRSLPVAIAVTAYPDGRITK